MKKLIFVFAILITSQIVYSQENKLLFSSEFEFMSSWYGIDAISKYRASINSNWAIECNECEKLKGVLEFKNPQQLLYKKYATLLPIFPKSFCKVPNYFLKQKDGTYIYMINFVDIGLVTPSEMTPLEVLPELYKGIEPLIYSLSLLCKSISNTEISRIHISICYSLRTEIGRFPNFIALSSSRLNIDNYHNGKITERQFLSKVLLYHTTGDGFKRIQ